MSLFGDRGPFDRRDYGFESLRGLGPASDAAPRVPIDNSDIIPISLYDSGQTQAESDEIFDQYVGDGRQPTDISPVDALVKHRYPADPEFQRG